MSMSNSAKAKREREMLLMMLTRVPTVSKNIVFDIVSLPPLEMLGLTEAVSNQNGYTKSHVIRDNKDEFKQVSEYVARYMMKQDPH